MFKLAVVATAATVCASGAFAQNFSGNLGFSYALPAEGEDRAVTEYFGGLEYAFNRNFSVGLDLEGYNFEDVDSTIASSTWHFIYHLDDATSFGLFSGADVEADEVEELGGTFVSTVYLAGLEAGTEFGAAEGEGYIGFASSDDIDDTLTMFGLSGKYAFDQGISAIGNFDYVSSDDISFSNIALGVEYEITNGPELYGKIGQRSADVDDGGDGDSNYLEIGASVAFGAERGTTFNRRSLLESFPTFDF